MDVKAFIGLNYEKLKNILRKLCNTSSIKFDEDIFHDTVLKVIYTIGEEIIDVEKNIYNYIITAYKTNLLRQTLYSYNKNRTEIEDMNDLNIPIQAVLDNIDFQNIIKKIKRNFGKEYTNYFIEWCNGYSIKELEETYDIHNLYYKFKLIKKYIQKEYEFTIKT